MGEGREGTTGRPWFRRSIIYGVILVLVAVPFGSSQAAATTPAMLFGSNAALASAGASASASSAVTGYEAGKAIDASTSTYWLSATGTASLQVTFSKLYYIGEVHVHMSGVPQPDVDVLTDPDGQGAIWSAVASVRGNAAFDLILSFGPGAAKQVRVDFLTTVVHTHTKTTKTCIEWDYDEYSGKKFCLAWSSTTTTYTETHPPQVTELEAYGTPGIDSDRDGLSDATEESLLYFQDAGFTGLPTLLPDTGLAAVYGVTWTVPWVGNPTGVYARVNLTHNAPAEIAIAVGFWDGAAWIDRTIYDPSGRAANGIPASITHTHTVTGERCIRDPDGTYCWTYTSTYTETHAVTFGKLNNQPTMTLGNTYFPSISGMTGSIPSVSLTVDLLRPASGLTAAETAAGIKAPGFQSEDFRARPMWRVLIMDFVPGNQGTFTGFGLRWEEKSDKANPDSDGDSLVDGRETLYVRSLPVVLDTDSDGLRDDYEAVPHSITLSVDGISSTLTGITTDAMKWDSDGDGLSDGEEYEPGLDGVVTNPADSDTDNDLLRDGDELLVHRSSAVLTDTDADTLSDYSEVSSRSLVLFVNGAWQTRTVFTFPYAADTDGDGLRDEREYAGTTSMGVVTDPSDWDTDDDGLGDNELWTVFTIRTLAQLETFLTAIEHGEPVKYYEPLIHDYITYHTEYAVTASPVSRDTDADGLSDLVESFLHSDPRSTDTDRDRIPDGRDDDPTIVEIERPMIWVDSIAGPEYFVDWGLTLKRYWVTYSVQDSAGISEAWVNKDGSRVHYHSVGGSLTAQFRDNFDIGWLDAFDGARFEIVAKDMNGNVDYITLQQPTIFDAVGNFLTSATIGGLGPESGGRLSGGWYAFRDTVVDLATLFLNPGAIFDGGKAVGDAFRSQGLGALVELGKALYEFIDGTQRNANPYVESECATNPLCNFNVFRYNWYAGYIATTIGLSLLGAAAAKAAVQGIKASQVFAKISGALGDLADASKVAQYVNRLRGIGIVNSRILIGAVFTTAFAAAAYLWPEIFGEWFSRYMGGAFVFLSVYSLGPGFSQDALKGVGRAIRDGVIVDTPPMHARMASYFDGVKKAYNVNPLDPTAGEHRVLFLAETPGVRITLPDRTILNAIVLKQGTTEWGWTHIWSGHADDFKKLLGANDPESVQRWIRNTVTAPGKFKVVYDNLGAVSEYRLARNFGSSANPTWVYVAVRGDGSITTAFPTDKGAYIASQFA